MKLPILVYPDRRLKQQSRPVTDFDASLHKLLDDMNETMMASNGIGLAAIQVRIPLRALLINLPDDEGNQYEENLIEVINPVILEKRGSIVYTEGCLSVPEYYDDVERAGIRVEFFTREGERRR
ncbi:peptide deformylase [Hydrogenimonas sp.]|nr:peptide deformylase [Hydrogenimonas sp.]